MVMDSSVLPDFLWILTGLLGGLLGPFNGHPVPLKTHDLKGIGPDHDRSLPSDAKSLRNSFRVRIVFRSFGAI